MTKHTVFNLIIAALCLTATLRSRAQGNGADPRSLTIYQIMVASFNHGEGGAPGYTAMWGPDNARKDGNLRGIIEAVPHIDSLGVNAVWLTPIFDSTKALFSDPKLNATGYFTNDYFKVDPNFGTEAELRELVDSLHSRGIYIILDGVFGHHGGVVTPSPAGHEIDNTPGTDCRGYQTPLSYPGSLEYFKDVATWWMENYDIDGWRLDQAYQACQNGTNYWSDIRRAVEETAAKRFAEGHRWGTLGYMVGEDWGGPEVINEGVYKDLGLKSAFDFDGNSRLTKLTEPFDDIRHVYSTPRKRGYDSDLVLPNLFLSNHDVYRVGDAVDRDSLYYDGLKFRHAILAGYSGPITLYYGDEYGDDTRDATGAQPDNIARTSGHLAPRNAGEAGLRDYIAAIMQARKLHPALWRGAYTFFQSGNLLRVRKTDPVTSETIDIYFPLEDTVTEAASAGRDLITGKPVSGKIHLEKLIPTFILND